MLRAELRKHNIRVMLINPSEVLTNFAATAGLTQKENATKLRAEDIAYIVKAALEMENRGFVPELSVFLPPIPRTDGQDISLMKTVLLLLCSNIFMTIAWYGHLKYRDRPLFLVIVVSWMIAFLEYCFQVPANRIGYGEFTAFQLKVIQESITLAVFVVFAFVYLGERLRWNYAVSFLCIFAAVAFAFWGSCRGSRRFS